jgi:hypothetical protein
MKAIDIDMAGYAKAYESSQVSPRRIIVGFLALCGLLFAFQRFFLSGANESFFSSVTHDSSIVATLTWNIAAINNNPFEYWITNDDPAYNKLMQDVSAFITDPGDKDVAVAEIFTDAMFEELMASMKSHTTWVGIDETKAAWTNDFRHRKIISEFVKDPLLGKKRLISMTDRVTNTINVVGTEEPLTRPTVINCYDGKALDGSTVTLDSVSSWWPVWNDFMFKRKVTVVDKREGGAKKEKAIYDMLQPIKKSKYPSLTEEEEKMSLPLQTLCGAIFDAILVSMMNQLSPVSGPGATNGGGWEGIRTNMCDRLNRHKTHRILEILETTYNERDIIFLQEVAGTFKEKAQAQALGSRYYEVMSPADIDADRDQNSFILLKKGRYTEVNEVTEAVLEVLKADNPKAPVAKGDVYAITARDSLTGHPFLLVSFHGDTNGLATIPVVGAVAKYAAETLPADYRLLFGLDANTYGDADEDQQGVVDFGAFYSSLKPRKLNSHKGQKPSAIDFTTFNARTHLQPQLNKAVAFDEIKTSKKGDKNPKDFILFYESDYTVVEAVKDNTGRKRYVEGMVFPTLDFPSDHGVSSALLRSLKEEGALTNPNLRDRE